jgi:ankyrin repeat protein
LQDEELFGEGWMIRWLAWALLGVLFLGGTAFVSLRMLRTMSSPSELARAAALDDTETIRALVRSGASLDARGSAGFTALDCAAREGRVDAIDTLLDLGASPDVLDHGPNGWTALHHAIHKNQLAAVEELLDRGADPDLASPSGETPLMRAAAEGHPRIAQALLDAGADPYAKSQDRSVLSYALRGGNAACVREIRKAAPELRVGHNLIDRVAFFTLRVRGRRAMLRSLASNRPSLNSKTIGEVWR